MQSGLKALAALLAMLGMVALSACNTVEGVGRDISAAGSTLAGTAEETQEEISN